MKGYKERGLADAGIKLIATGDITDDGVLEAMGDPTLGLITSFHYSAAHDSPENKAFVKTYAEVNGTKLRPNFMAVGGYDGMAAIYEALKKTGGDTNGDKVIAAMKGLKLTSPRGPLTIDPDTRDPVQTVYIRKVEKTGGGLYNVEFERLENQKDPGSNATPRYALAPRHQGPPRAYGEACARRGP
jgi:branched-chain amino acid transport system substrate-binding protein